MAPPPNLPSKLPSHPRLNPIGGQGVPGPQMAKGTSPNSLICCPSSVQRCEKGSRTGLERRGIRTDLCSRICRGGCGAGWKGGMLHGWRATNAGEACGWARFCGHSCSIEQCSGAVHSGWWCYRQEVAGDGQQSIAPMHPRRQPCIPCSRAAWTSLSRMDARNSVPGLPKAQRQHVQPS